MKRGCVGPVSGPKGNAENFQAMSCAWKADMEYSFVGESNALHSDV